MANFEELLYMIENMNNNFYYENKIIPEKNVEINLDKWKPGTPLWITGTSGDGKSTLAREYAQKYNAEIVPTDALLLRLSFDKNKFERKINSGEIVDTSKSKMVMEYINLHPNLPRGLRGNGSWATPFDMKKYWLHFFNWIINNAKLNPKYNNHLIVVEGCDICLMDPEAMSTQPLIILGNSRLKSGYRRIKRDMTVDNHGLIDSFIREIKRGPAYINLLDSIKNDFMKNVKKYYMINNTNKL